MNSGWFLREVSPNLTPSDPNTRRFCVITVCFGATVRVCRLAEKSQETEKLVQSLVHSFEGLSTHERLHRCEERSKADQTANC